MNNASDKKNDMKRDIAEGIEFLIGSKIQVTSSLLHTSSSNSKYIIVLISVQHKSILLTASLDP